MLFCLLDHDNVAPNLQHLPSYLNAWLDVVSREHNIATIEDLIVRSYGGWWREEHASDSRFAAAQDYSQYCPALISTAGHYWRVRFEFADSLLTPAGNSAAVPTFHHTVVSRPAPPLSISDVGGPVCTEQDCEIQKCRRWLYRRRGCTRNACPQNFGRVWVRTEQKQVDTHLAIDLVQLCRSWPEQVHVALFSDDVDFLPALTASIIGNRSATSVTHVRIAGRSTYLDPFLTANGVRILTP